MYMLEKIYLKALCFDPFNPNYLHTYKLTLVSPIKEFYIDTIWVKCFVIQFWDVAKNLVKLYKNFSIIF
jgi:hypothetical protein